jgi:hypothetical protein
VAFIVHAAIVEVGEFPEYLDAQARHRIEVFEQGGAAETLDQESSHALNSVTL